jgi:6-phosphogluconolactonase
MIQSLASADLPWQLVHVFQTDERVVAPEDAERTLPHLRRMLSSSRRVRCEQVHPMPVEETDLSEAAREYAMELQQIAGSPPILDVIHLGIGTDGHAASLVPGDPVLDVADADVAISRCYQGCRRMTLTYPVINRAEAIFWFVTGKDKAKVLKRLCDGDTEIPAGRIRTDRAIIVADRAAASLVRANVS